MMCRMVTCAVLGTTLLVTSPCKAFQVFQIQQRQSCTQLWGKSRRGRLAKTLPSGVPVSKRKRRDSSSKRKNAAPADKGISPSLAEWASRATVGESPTEDVATTEDEIVEVVTDDVSTPEFVKFESGRSKKKKSKSSRRAKQTTRKAEEQARYETIDRTVRKLESLVEEKSGATLDDILNVVRELVRLESGNLRMLTAGAKRLDYRLAWVGGDDSICHVGTGLHKVPLARLQEVFVTFKGKSRVELLEVIRVIGPFPNVRNTLQGESSVQLGETVTSWRITMDSMVDGAGKELLAGTADNIRKVDLHVYFASENALVAVVPPEDDRKYRKDPFEDSGSHVLVFVREDEMDAKLDSLRVS